MRKNTHLYLYYYLFCLAGLILCPAEIETSACITVTLHKQTCLSTQTLKELWFTSVQIIDHFGGLKQIGESCGLHSALSQWAASGQTHTETVFPCKPTKLLSSQGVCFCLPLQMVWLRWAHGCFLSCDSQSICFSVSVFTVRFEDYLQEFTDVCSYYRGNY